MLKKFNWQSLLFWLGCFGSSFLVETLGWANQGKAFFWIVLGLLSLISLICLITLICFGVSTGTVSQSLKKAARLLLIIGGAIFIALLVTWGASKVFNVDFYTTFEILSLGASCMPSANKT